MRAQSVIPVGVETDFLPGIPVPQRYEDAARALVLQRADEPLGAAVALRCSDEGREDVAPSQVISFWKLRDMYWLP